MWLTGRVEEISRVEDMRELVIRIPAAGRRISEGSEVTLRVNDGRYITAEQRRKAYATLADISEYTGYLPEETKQRMKWLHMTKTGERYFSLSDCSMTLAREFINTLLDFCLYNGVQMAEGICDRTDDIDHALYICIKYRKCAICGRAGEIHHWDAIGMGNDRRTVDDRFHRKICLCRMHHTQAHTLGGERFAAMYHVYGILYAGEEAGEEVRECS